LRFNFNRILQDNILDDGGRDHIHQVRDFPVGGSGERADEVVDFRGGGAIQEDYLIKPDVGSFFHLKKANIQY
jgi:hypothetical protein